MEITAEVENRIKKAQRQKLIQNMNYTPHVNSKGASRSTGKHEMLSYNESADSSLIRPSHLSESSPRAEKGNLGNLLLETHHERSKGQPLLVSQSGK